MPVDITVPRLGWSMDEFTFVEWLKASGEPVETGDMVFVLESEKAVHEIESFDCGTVHLPPDVPQPGDTVEVGQLIGYLLADGDSPPPSVQSATAFSEKTESVTVISKANSRPRVAPGQETRSPQAASPRARRRARELGIDWNHISGSGRNGRVREGDVIATASRSLPKSPPESAPDVPGTHQPGSNIRRTIAERTLAAARHTVPVTLTTKVDAEKLVNFRETLRLQAEGSVVPSYTDIVIKLVAAALVECRELNACWHDKGVYTYDHINIGLAVDTSAGLVVPVLNDVSSLSLNQIAEQSLRLVKQSRAGTLSRSQLRGGTFTVSSLGMFDIDFFTPVLNLPQAAILGVGRVVREPVVRGDEIVPGNSMGLSLTFDHRVIDGAPAARWLQKLTLLFQHPDQENSRD